MKCLGIVPVGSVALIVCGLCILGPGAMAQQDAIYNTVNGTAPLAINPGLPAGDFSLAEFEHINPYNALPNISIPLLNLKGRSGTSISIVKHVNAQQLTVNSYLRQFASIGLLYRTYVFYTVFNHISKILPGYGPGVLIGSKEVNQYFMNYSYSSSNGNGGFDIKYAGYQNLYTHFTLYLPDGSSVNFVDQKGCGVTNSYVEPYQTGTYVFYRGRVFVSTGGEGMTFVSDQTVVENTISDNGEESAYPSGYIYAKDGTRYRIDGALITQIRDRNGNVVTYGYNNYRCISITDSLGRQVSISYGDEMPAGSGNRTDTISYKGSGGAARSITVRYSKLANVLDVGRQLGRYLDLFPELDLANGEYFNPDEMVSQITLPDGRAYSFRYSEYGDTTRVVLPTGGSIRYVYSTGVLGGFASGLFPLKPDLPDMSCGESTCSPIIPLPPVLGFYRRVIERRTYGDDSNESSCDNVTFYSRPDSTTDHVSFAAQNYVEVKSCQPDVAGGCDQVLSFERHYYRGYNGNQFGTPLDQLLENYNASVGGNGMPPRKSEGRYDYGREVKIENLNTGGQVIKTVETTWDNGTRFCDWETYYSQNPHINAIKTTLQDVTPYLVTTNRFLYDQYNNQTDSYVYDYGEGQEGALLRRSHTDFKVDDPGYVSPITDPDNPGDGSVLVHLRALPQIKETRDGDNAIATHAEIQYDGSTLVQRINISGQDPVFSRPQRGNVTAVTGWVDTSGLSSITLSQQFDSGGNVVSVVDGRGKTTTVDYEDRFGIPDNESESNTAVGELLGKNAYAFPTRVTNPLGHATYTQYDYYTGKPVNREDPNGVVSSIAYNDPLDRPTQLVRAYGSDQSQTTITYDLPHMNVGYSIVTTKDQDAFGDNILKNQAIYNGLGRATETRVFESASDYFRTEHQYDGLGRAIATSNPYRPQSEIEQWTTTHYDTLGRASKITTPDLAHVDTDFRNNDALVTDQALKQRKSTTDALGRLVKVTEYPSGEPSYETSYIYDALGDLRQVTQGIQRRYFVYDALGRLIRARNPEQDINLNLSLTDPLTGNSQWSMAYGYDQNGNLTSTTDSNGTLTTSEYDDVNRLTLKQYVVSTPAVQTPSVTFTYDTGDVQFSKGRLTAVANGISNTSYRAYDSLGRIRQSTQITDGITYPFSYTYNRADALTTVAYPSGRVITTGYDGAGRAYSVSQQSASYVSSVGYAPHGVISNMRLGNGRLEQSCFNNRLQPTVIRLRSQLVDCAGPTDADVYDLLHLKFNYGSTDNNGNVLTQAITAKPPNHMQMNWTGSQSYTYDQMNRLSTFMESSAWGQTYEIDRYGNRWVREGYIDDATLTPQSPSDFSVSNNRLVGTGITFDNAGNLTNDRAARHFTYDAENRQVTFTGPTNVSYYYDGEGHRIKKTESGVDTIFIYDAMGRLAAEYSPLGPQDAAGTKYLTLDHLGSIRLVTDASGQAISYHDYLPFGGEIPSSQGGRSVNSFYAASDTTRQRFSGKERDAESGLDYFGARYYSSSQGRFSSPDAGAKGIVPSHPQTWNKYAYAVNNPLAYTDVNGEWPWYVHEEMIDLAFGGVLSGDELKQLKKVNYAMDFGPGQQEPSKSNEHSMCVPGQDPGACTAGIENVLFTDMQVASLFSRGAALSLVGQAMHTIADWTSPVHVSDAGIPYTWGDPPKASIEMAKHVSGEANMYANPGRYYLGVRLMVAMYLKRFPGEAEKFKSLDVWILQDARRRAAMQLATQGPYDYLDWSIYRANMADRLALCWAGNPSACPE